MQAINYNEMIHDVTRLKWACRRGMLELDVLLGNFLQGKYEDCADDEKVLFIKLLECSDPDLFAWLLGKDTPEDAGMLKITDMIRCYAKSKV